jgi:hypothetical protein
MPAGWKVLFESVDEGFESFVVLALDEDLAGGKAVFEGVPAGNGLALRRDWAGGLVFVILHRVYPATR